MAANMIQYECVSTSHAASSQHPDKLTVHDGHWAFCPFDARADGHEWRETGGVEFHELMRHRGLAIVPPPQTFDEAKPRERASSAR